MADNQRKKKDRFNTGILFPIIHTTPNGPVKKGDFSFECCNCKHVSKVNLIVFKKLDKHSRPYEVLNLNNSVKEES